jgi:serine/threonine protein kinase
MTDPLDLILDGWRQPGLVPGYDLVNVLGSGGQGLVIKARKRATGRTYAIKFLKPPDQAHPETWRQPELDHIAQLAELRHPNLVSIEDQGEVRSIRYLVLEYAGEQSLKTLIRNRRLTVQDTVRWVGQVAEAVQYLHDHGVLHLDVKPSNVLLMDGRAKLGDFGLVRLSDQSGDVDLSLALGTPDYVAPEIISLHRASPASDVFGLGRILDDALIAASVHDARPPKGLLDLVTEATTLEPLRRPTLGDFRRRVADPKVGRAITFRTIPVRTGPRFTRIRR